jgi:quercetin 2,3-dioxygenase
MTLHLRPAAQRGHADLGWLRSHHSFSFADYFDPAHMGFRTLRVINDDTIAAATGFDTHGHRDMEIITYVTRGAVEHKDSTGSHAVTRRGEVQRMTAGKGVFHSEFNASAEDDLHLLQIWILPAAKGLAPGYEQGVFDDDAKRDRLRLIASSDGRDGSLTIHQDAAIYASVSGPGSSLSHALAAGRGAWVQVVAGVLTVNGVVLGAGDGASIEEEGTLSLVAGAAGAEFLLFDLA